MEVRVDDEHLHQHSFADDTVFVTSSINQSERVPAEFDETCERIDLQLNLDKTLFMRNGCGSAPFTLSETNISECSSYVYLGRGINIVNDLTSDLGKQVGDQNHRGYSEENQKYPSP
ncbi:hypothetical protein RB195_000740 [Necator americanus]|uniref:Reverse transcriptase domain-containing protein n=1 Tax=Necator americanus TaxID=51031 RepID=A0ABR1DB57_NECAM